LHPSENKRRNDCKAPQLVDLGPLTRALIEVLPTLQPSWTGWKAVDPRPRPAPQPRAALSSERSSPLSSTWTAKASFALMPRSVSLEAGYKGPTAFYFFGFGLTWTTSVNRTGSCP
jgi:hypothetical protein